MKVNICSIAAILATISYACLAPSWAATPQKSEVIVSSSDEILIDYIDSADVVLYWDILAGRTKGHKAYCQTDAENCSKLVYSNWMRQMGTPTRIVDVESRKLFQSSISEKPPHIQQEIVAAAFKKSYERVTATLTGKSVCYFYKPWSLTYLNGKYYLNQEQISFPDNEYIGFTPSGSPTIFGADLFTGQGYLSMNGKMSAPIPAKIMGDANYARFAKYANIPEGPSRPILKICGLPKGDYLIPLAPNAPPWATQELHTLFELSKPIEVVQPPSMKRLDTLPLEWLK